MTHHQDDSRFGSVKSYVRISYDTIQYEPERNRYSVIVTITRQPVIGLVFPIAGDDPCSIFYSNTRSEERRVG